MPVRPCALHQNIFRNILTLGQILVLICAASLSGPRLTAQPADANLPGHISLSTSTTSPDPEFKQPPPDPIKGKTLEFRAMLATWEIEGAKPHHQTWNLQRWCNKFWDNANWTQLMTTWGKEGYNAIVWWGPNEMVTGEHRMLRFKDFPEAREISPEENEKYIAQIEWIFAEAHKHGLKNFLFTQNVWYTDAFAKAHGIDKPMEASLQVHPSQKSGYLGIHNNGVWNKDTAALTQSMYKELLEIYTDLDGFWGNTGESLPGNKSTFFRDVIAPAVKASGKHPLYIAYQWQLPIEDYRKNILPYYDNLWFGFHGHNSEQLTDSAPYAAYGEYAERVGLPAVISLYPANIMHFPLNSPRLAYEIVTEWKKVPETHGYLYWEWTGRKLSPLFREALAYYAQTDEPYNPDRWIAKLEEQFGDRAAAEHFLKAYDVSSRIFPELCALIYCPHDNWRRELSLPYKFMDVDWMAFSYQTSRERGTPLVPVWLYAKRVAMDPGQYENQNGTDGTHPPFVQHAIWRGVGGSAFDIIPPMHMEKIRKMGEFARAEAEAGMKTVKKNQEDAERLRKYMQAYQLMTGYFEKKVAAGVAALVYKETKTPERKAAAEKLADEALASYKEAATWMHANIDPIALDLYGTEIKDLINGDTLETLMKQEEEDRRDIGKVFKWDK